MIFVFLGRIFAHIGLWLSLLGLATSIAVAVGSENLEMNAALSRTYLGSQNSGEAMTEAIQFIFFSLVLGLLCEIARKKN